MRGGKEEELPKNSHTYSSFVLLRLLAGAVVVAAAVAAVAAGGGREGVVARDGVAVVAVAEEGSGDVAATLPARPNS